MGIRTEVQVEWRGFTHEQTPQKSNQSHAFIKTIHFTTYYSTVSMLTRTAVSVKSGITILLSFLLSPNNALCLGIDSKRFNERSCEILHHVRKKIPEI